MKSRRVKIGVVITLIGIFFAVIAYISIQEIENEYIFAEEKSSADGYIMGVGILNRYIMGVGILTFIIGIGYTVFGLIPDKEINKSSKTHEHI